MSTLYKIISKLKTIKQYDAYIPAVWNDINASGLPYIITNTRNDKAIIKVKFPDYFIEKLTAIHNEEIPKQSQNDNPTIYNLLVRLTTAFNHSKYNEDQHNRFKKTGTLLKTIALLPYLKSLGTNILYILPITSIGQSGKKGDLGSPYSINNPYQIDENIGEPLLKMTIEEQFEALIEAAHKLGIKVVCEFIFRTSSKNSPLAIEHPEWFYWIKKECEEKYCSPIFDTKILKELKEKVKNKNYKELPEPSLDYINQFTEPPTKVELINGKIIGYCNDKEVVIPGAFADWPPDDMQPPWSDVTYLKIYDHPKFNYIAYNTIRMYDDELSKPRWEATPLWRHIENIIPFYQNKFGIDGVMIDMGHALPNKLLSRIIAKAKKINKEFIFWEENFIINEKSVKAGFNCVMGALPFDAHQPQKISNFISNVHNIPIKCFATSETHNTPRTASRKGGKNLSKITYLISKILPLPTFIHSGFELCETMPVNTGLGFEDIDTTKLTADVLPLFSKSKLDWTNENNIVDFIIETNNILEQYLKNNYKLKTINTKNDNVVAFEIIGSKKLIFVASYDYPADINIETIEADIKYKLLLGDASFILNKNKLKINLKEFSFVLLSEH